jgi:hypothetical protein
VAAGAVGAAGGFSADFLADPPFRDSTSRAMSVSDTEDAWPLTGTPSATNFSTVSFEERPRRFATS